MTQDDDRLLQALARLPLIRPNMEWETRVRARCHAAISKRASRGARARKNLSGAAFIGLVAAAALCVYLVAILGEAARLAGFSLVTPHLPVHREIRCAEQRPATTHFTASVLTLDSYRR